MPTYVYETCPSDPDVTPRRFEVFQKMSDDPLTEDPETGDPVRRVVSGGQGYHQKGLRRSTVVDKSSPAATACGCATGKPHSHGHNHSHGHSHGHGHGGHSHGGHGHGGHSH